jgi:hypothetical protein
VSGAHRGLVLAAFGALAIGAAGCGGGVDAHVVAHVGSVAITAPELAEQMGQLAPEHYVPDAPKFAGCVRRQEQEALQQAPAASLRTECAQRYASLKTEALDAMISSYWLIGEAEERRLLAGRGELGASARQVLAQRSASELLAEIDRKTPAVTEADVRAYYRQNGGKFERAEVRDVDLVENLPSVAAATKVKQDIEAGRARLAAMALHESVERFKVPGGGYATRSGEEAIFLARPHLLSGPVKLNRHYAIFEVERVRPPTRAPFRSVESQVKRRLTAARRQRYLERFIGAWHAKWLARTSCAAGYVVQKCREFSGTKSPESPLALA